MSSFRVRAIKISLLVIFCFAALLLPVHSWGQGAVTSASLVGDVVDHTGAAVAGAKVTLVDKSTGLSRSSESDGSGHFSFLQLPPGKAYALAVEQKGFQRADVSPLDLTVGSTRSLKLTLKVGEVNETVEVSAEAVTIETTQSEVSDVIQTQQLRDLPLNQRSFTALVTQQPGLVNITSTAPPSVLSAATNTGSYISANGSMGSSVAYLMDGVNFSNGSFTAPGTASAGDTPGVEAIQEFKVLTHTYSAAYGGAGAAVVSFATKNGTNDLHGSAYEYFRNNSLDSRNYFDFNQFGQATKPPFHRNQFGGSLGGPIIKDKTFFFLNYEGLRQSRTVTDIGFVPDGNARMGLLPPADDPFGPAVPVEGFDPNVVPILDLYPSPNGANLGGGIAESFFPDYKPVRQDFGLVNITHNLTSKDVLQGRYQIVDADATQLFNLPDFIFTRQDRLQNFLFKWTRTINTHLVNTASFSFLRQNIQANVNPAAPLLPTQYTGNPARQTIGVISVGNGSAGTGGGALTLLGIDDASPFHLAKQNFPFNDDLIYVRGKHSLKFGGMVQRYMWNWSSATIPGGSYTFPTIENLLTSTPLLLLIHVDGADSTFHIRTTQIAWYVEDSWRLTNRLTMNIGLRHEFQTPVLEDTNNKLGNWQKPTDTTIHVGTPYNNYSLTQFQPRFGLAWDPYGDGKTVIRAGFGIFNDFIDFSGNAQGQLQWNAPQPVLNTSFFPSGVFPQCSFACTAPTPFFGLVTGVLTPVNSPTTTQYSLELERSLPSNFIFTLSYAGSQSRHLPRKLEANYNLPCPGLTDFAGRPVWSAGGVNCAPQPTGAPGIAGQGFSLYSKRYDTNANYNALTAKLSRTVSSLTFNFAYTWSKAMSESDGFNSNNIITGVAMASIDPANPRYDYSVSAFSVNQRFTENITWELPFGKGRKFMNDANAVVEGVLGGWSLSSLGTFQTGQPFTVFLGYDSQGLGDVIDFPDRPNMLRHNGVILGKPSQYFDTSAFTAPAAGLIGSASRTPLVGPGFNQFDISALKHFKLTERFDLALRGDFFNIPNHPNFALPAATLFQAPGLVNPTAGKITSTVGVGSRETQISLKLTF
jgi:hypothetical protein